MHKMQPDLKELPSYQHMAVGLISGACGPLTNAPIDTIKTRKSSSLIEICQNDVLSPLDSGLQRSKAEPGDSALKRITNIAGDMWKREGSFV